MNRFIEKNRRLLVFYSIAAQITGWLIMVLGIMVLGGSIITQAQIGFSQMISLEWAVRFFQRSGLFLIATGLLSLGTAQLIRYLFDSKYQRGWLLRYGDKILYVFAFLVLWHSIAMAMLHFSTPDISSSFLRLLGVLPTVLYSAAKLLVLTGLAQFLKRIMPVIEESKTLV